jgi:pSer/pThr/pTyr-binding forkhead associated (FHA) protein
MLGKLLDRTAGARREIAITKEEFLIGRGADCDLRLGISAVSRHHCLIRFQGGEVNLVDLGSANGSYVNGQRVRSQAALKHGDEIGLGELTFVIELTGQSGIDWGVAGADVAARTLRIPHPRLTGGDTPVQPPPVQPPEKDEGHPLGEAGGL